jgi:hypothetical protein
MSFGWTCMFRKGSWFEFRRFALNQRRNVPDRIFQINRELEKIGSISILYERVEGVVTERRVGFAVAERSALGKLLTAYIAQGGNPFDISMFLSPDSAVTTSFVDQAPEGSVIVDGKAIVQTQPYSGAVYPESQEEDEYEGLDTSGWLPLWKYPPRKLGSAEANIWPEANDIGGQVYHARRWLTQEVSTLRNNLEARIIKLADLHEQLVIERDDILFRALSGSAAEVKDFDPKSQLLENHLSAIVTNIDLNFFKAQEGREGAPVPDFTQPIRVQSPLKLYQCLLEDAPTGEELWTAL